MSGLDYQRFLPPSSSLSALSSPGLTLEFEPEVVRLRSGAAGIRITEAGSVLKVDDCGPAVHHIELQRSGGLVRFSGYHERQAEGDERLLGEQLREKVAEGTIYYSPEGRPVRVVYTMKGGEHFPDNDLEDLSRVV